MAVGQAGPVTDYHIRSGAEKKAGLIALLVLTRDILETSIDLLGFSAPDRM